MLSKLLSCCKICRRHNELLRDDEITILVLGLEDSGKTAICHIIANIERYNYFPTVGLKPISIIINGQKIKLLDLGGSENIRKIWDYHFVSTFGVIFVIDSSRIDNFENNKNLLTNLMYNKYLKGKPFLIYANKQDYPLSIDINNMEDILLLELLANNTLTPCSLERSSISKDDYKYIMKGFHWIIYTIQSNYKNLINRIKFDMNEIKYNTNNKEQQLSDTNNEQSNKIDNNQISHRPKSAPTSTITNKTNKIIMENYFNKTIYNNNNTIKTPKKLNRIHSAPINKQYCNRIRRDRILENDMLKLEKDLYQLSTADIKNILKLDIPNLDDKKDNEQNDEIKEEPK